MIELGRWKGAIPPVKKFLRSKAGREQEGNGIIVCESVTSTMLLLVDGRVVCLPTFLSMLDHCPV